MGRELDRVGEVGEAGARLKSPRIDPAVDQGLERGASLVDAEAEGLAGGTERCEPDASLFEESMGVPDIEVGGHRQIVVERREEGSDEAGERLEGATHSEDLAIM